jgi:hypothetical protein
MQINIHNHHEFLSVYVYSDHVSLKVKKTLPLNAMKVYRAVKV